MTTTQQVHIATELRYMGKGTIESKTQDGNLIVSIEGMGRGKVAAAMIFKTKREALLHAQVPQQAGWSDVAKLNLIGW
jgi:hypothetical protein